MFSFAPSSDAGRISRPLTVFAALIVSALVCLLVASQAKASPPVINSAPVIDTSSSLSAGGWAEYDGMDYTSDEDTTWFYQWYLCSGTGGSCLLLNGESDDEIDVREGWVGKTLRLRVTIVNEDNGDEFATALSAPVGPVVDAPAAPLTAILNHGTVQLGVNPEGDLIVDGGTPSAEGDRSKLVGLRFAPLNLESISDGSPAEGWGVADGDASISGWSNRNTGGSTNLDPVSFTSDEDSATSTVDLLNGESAPVIRVSHAFAPTASPSLFEATVTMTNTTDETIDHTRYRRVVDWDVQPTPFNEYVTVQGGNATALTGFSDDGFSSTNPLDSLDDCNALVNEDIVDGGPNDCGAAFDFDFGALEADESKSFKLYYGASPDEATALAALQSVGAEAYTLGQSSSELGGLAGTPATFMLAFTGIGGDPILADDPTAGDTVLDTVPETYSQDDQPDFSFHSTEAGTDFECSLDAEPWFSCTSPIDEIDPLDEGWHLFRVRSVVYDELEPEVLLGADPTPAATSFKVDNSAPYTDVDIIGASPDVTASPKFKFGSDGGDPDSELTFECELDEGPATDCTDGLELTDVTEGEHTLLITATDMAGNVEDPSYNYTWTYAYTEPPVTAIATPGGAKSSKDLSIEFEAPGDIDYYRCSLDGAGFSECGSPVQITDLDEGAHSFKVYAIAYNGLVETTPKELAFSYAAPSAGGNTPVIPPVLAIKPSGKIGKPSKKGTVKVTAVCNEAVCTLSATVKIGKKKYKLKGKALTKGTTAVKLSFTKKLKNALKNKKRKKAVLSVVLSSSAGKTTITKKF
ncbi:MAG: hypothetical protein ACRDKE_08785 [Solirubrobacterales bacterium]